MLVANYPVAPTRMRNKRLNASAAIIASVICLFSAACSGSGEDADGRALPSDRQVVADATPADVENVVDVHVFDSSDGESYLHRDSLVWTYDRGVVIKRKAMLSDIPDAVVVVGGLARYQLVGDTYVYHRFLTTYNEYEGIPAPSAKELMKYVKKNLGRVFIGREHNILSVDSVDLDSNAKWEWHTPNSFSAAFRIQYRQRLNNTTIENRAGNMDIRFYRNSIDDPVQNLLATETSRTSIATNTYEASVIDRMPTLRSNFQ